MDEKAKTWQDCQNVGEMRAWAEASKATPVGRVWSLMFLNADLYGLSYSENEFMDKAVKVEWHGIGG